MMEGDLVAKEKFVNMENIEVYFYVKNKISSHLHSLPCARNNVLQVSIFLILNFHEKLLPYR